MRAVLKLNPTTYTEKLLLMKAISVYVSEKIIYPEEADVTSLSIKDDVYSIEYKTSEKDYARYDEIGVADFEEYISQCAITHYHRLESLAVASRFGDRKER